MEFKMPVRYLEAYLPTPRSRKLRYREANDSITVDVLSLSAGEILAVFRVHDYSIHAGGFEAETIYAHSGQLWRRSYEHDFYSGAAHTPATAQTLAEVLGRYRTYGALGNIEEEYAKAREYAKSFLLIDGELYRTCGEPMYEIRTFGLGHNHGVGWGTTISITYCYNNNISKDRYFTALERDKAITTALRIAVSRGDTKALDHLRNLEDNIEVFWLAAVKRNPAIEHGDGDPFLNTLDGLCASANSPSESAALVMAATAKEISK